MSRGNICVSRSSGLREHDYKYLTRRTGLSRDEIKNIYDQFNAGNEDKKLDKNEFSALYLKLDPKGHKHMEKIIDFVYAAFDRNNNGSINFREFLFAYAMTNDDDLKDKLSFAFEVFDSNNNGTLSGEEIDAVLDAMTAVNGKPAQQINVKEIIQKLDTNGNNKVSKNEFVNGLLANDSLRALMNPFD